MCCDFVNKFATRGMCSPLRNNARIFADNAKETKAKIRPQALTPLPGRAIVNNNPHFS